MRLLGPVVAALAVGAAAAGDWASCGGPGVDMAGGDEDVNREGELASMSLVQTNRRLLTTRRGASPFATVGGPFAARKHCTARAGTDVQCYPDLMLAGASKCGSTSIASYLLAHPQVIMEAYDQKLSWTPPPTFGDSGPKIAELEVHIFDSHVFMNTTMEEKHWEASPPLPAEKAGDVLQVEYTPNYIYSPEAPFNILQVYPNARSIKYLVMFRDPTKRAVSAWKFHYSAPHTNLPQIGYGRDMRSFKQMVDEGFSQRKALEACYMESLVEQRPANASEAVRILTELPIERHKDVLFRCFWGRTDTHDATNAPIDAYWVLQHAHVDKGVYIDQVRRWFSLLGRENFFVFSLEQWVADNVGMYQKIADFVGYTPVGPNGFKTTTEMESVLNVTWNDGEEVEQVNPPPPIDPADVARLREFYAPYTEELFQFLGSRLW